jgi:hypothetical protein
LRASDVGFDDDELAEPPAASENLILGVLNAFAQVDEEGNTLFTIEILNRNNPSRSDETQRSAHVYRFNIVHYS